MFKARLSLLHASAILLIFSGLSCDNHTAQETDGPFPSGHLEPVSIEATQFDNFTEPKPHTIVADHAEIRLPDQVRKTAEAFLAHLPDTSASEAITPLEELFDDELALECAREFLGRFPKGAGGFDRVLNLSYRESYAGRYVQARCRWTWGYLRLRFFVDETSGKITGLWIARDEASRFPMQDVRKDTPVPARKDARDARSSSKKNPTVGPPKRSRWAGKGARRFHSDTHSLTLRMHVDPAKVNFRGPIKRNHWAGILMLWRALPDHFPRISDPEMRIQGLDGRVWQAFPIKPNFRRRATFPRWSNYEFATEMPNEKQTVTIESLSAGDYCFVWNLGSGRLITRHFTLDGTQKVTELDLPLEVVPKVTLTLQDSKTGRVLNDRAFRPFLAPEINRGIKAKGSSWNSYEADPSKLPDRNARCWNGGEWGQLGRFEIRPSQQPDGHYVFKNVPPGKYTVSLQGQKECIWRKDGLPKTNMPLSIEVDGKHDFLITTEQLREVIDTNIAMYVPNEKDFKDCDSRRERAGLMGKIPFSLLRYCGQTPEYDRLLVWLMRRDYRMGGGTDWNAFHLALDRFDKGYPVNERNAPGIDFVLRCSHVNSSSFNEHGPCVNVLGERCITLLRNYEKTLAPETPPSKTTTSQDTSSVAPPALRPLLDDLRSSFGGRRAYGLLQLGRLGSEARPALPAIRSLLDDKATAFEYEEIDFDPHMHTIADLAARVIQQIEKKDPGPANEERSGHH